MPIYEFFCKGCNTVFNFYSKTVNPQKKPACPRCSGPLKRQVSLFSCIDSSKQEKGPEDLPLDESKLEKAMSTLATEAEQLNEEDPRQAANLMRKFSEMTGVKMGEGMTEALRRMETGEDPEKIEAEMGDILENEDPFLSTDTKDAPKKAKRNEPLRDETLYEL